MHSAITTPGAARMDLGPGARHAGCCSRDGAGFPPGAAGSRDASRNQHTADDGSGVTGDLARRADHCLRRHFRRPVTVVAALAGFRRGTAVDGDRWCTKTPFWSPDSRSVGFFADGKLKRIDIDGGSVQTLANAPRGTGGAWNRDSVILFTTLGDPIFRVSDTGGEPVAVTRLRPSRAVTSLHNSCPMVATFSIGCEAVPK